MRDAEGESIVILSTADNNVLLQEEERKVFLGELAKIRYRVTLASKEPAVIASARRLGITVYDKTRKLRKVLKGHPKATEALRLFSPSLWRQHWRSRLQSIGLLSLPRMRIGVLIVLSSGLFLFVIFRLLPSATVVLTPRKEVVTHTMNVILAVSGAAIDLPSHVRTIPLLPISVTHRSAITFDDISPEFIGSDASVTMTVTNKKKEAVTLREGSRLMNQAGMIFKIQNGISVPAEGRKTVAAKAEHVDLYGKVIGDRGNVPVGLKWEFPGLPAEDKLLVYAENKEAGRGGRTAYRNVLQAKDLDFAKRRLEQELLASAKEMIKEELEMRSASMQNASLEFLNKPDLIKTTYSGFVMPTAFIGETVNSVPVEGSIVYTIPAYDAEYILREFGGELQLHIGDGKRLLPGSAHLEPSRVVVFDFADNLSWIKMTVDLLATEEYVLDPLSPTGARFGKRVREAIAGLGRQDAERIVRNFPEVDGVSISIWPPWNRTVPGIPSNIAIETSK